MRTPGCVFVDVESMRCCQNVRKEKAKLSCRPFSHDKGNRFLLTATVLLGSILGTHLNTKGVPAKLFEHSNKNGQNKKISKSVYPPTKPIHT